MAKDLRELLTAAASSPETRLSDFPIEAPPGLASADSAPSLISELAALGVRLNVEDGRLKVNAPKGVLTDTVKEPETTLDRGKRQRCRTITSMAQRIARFRSLLRQEFE